MYSELLSAILAVCPIVNGAVLNKHRTTVDTQFLWFVTELLCTNCHLSRKEPFSADKIQLGFCCCWNLLSKEKDLALCTVIFFLCFFVSCKKTQWSGFFFCSRTAFMILPFPTPLCAIVSKHACSLIQLFSSIPGTNMLSLTPKRSSDKISSHHKEARNLVINLLRELALNLSLLTVIFLWRFLSGWGNTS